MNIALKGILGIRAMAEIALIHGDHVTSDSYIVCQRQYNFLIYIVMQRINPSINSQMHETSRHNGKSFQLDQQAT